MEALTSKSHVSLQEIFTKYTNHKKNNIVKLIVEPLGILSSYLVIRYTNLSANNITAVSLLLGIVAAGLAVSGYLGWSALCMYIATFLDCTDGKVSLIRGQSSPSGQLFDVMVDRSITFMMTLSYIYLFFTSGEIIPIVLLTMFAMIFFYTDSIELSFQRYVLIQGGTAKDYKKGYAYTKGDWYRTFFRLKDWRPVRFTTGTLMFIIAPLTGAYVLVYALSVCILVFDFLWKILSSAIRRKGNTNAPRA